MTDRGNPLFSSHDHIHENIFKIYFQEVSMRTGENILERIFLSEKMNKVFWDKESITDIILLFPQ